MSVKKNKVLLTGGHLSPLLAVLPILQKHADCVVVGRKYTFEEDATESLEYKVLTDMGISFYNLKAGRLQRKLSKHTIPSLLRSPSAYAAALNVLAREKPDVVLTFGGYVGLPVALAAFTRRIPVVLHEQTMRAGLTNRTIARIAKTICISYATSAQYFPAKKTVLTGNPIRPEVFTVDKKISVPQDLPILFITGGSTGAHFINTCVEYLLEQLLSKFAVIHQTGDSQTYKDYERLDALHRKMNKEKKERYILRKFILPSEIGWVYKESDVILSRAGANTVSELLALGKKAILIPLQFGQKQEQLENAKFYEEAGYGEYIEQKDVNLSDLLQKLIVLKDKKVPARKTTYVTDAAEKITEVVLNVSKK